MLNSAAMMGLPVNGPVALPPEKGTAGTRHEVPQAAAEFESILLNQWLDGAENSFGSVPGTADEEDSGDQQMKSFAVQVLAKGLTAQGGIGLTPLVAQALAARTKTDDSQHPTAGTSKTL